MAAKGGGELLSPIRSKLTRTVTPSNRDVDGVIELNTTEYWLDCAQEGWSKELVAGWARLGRSRTHKLQSRTSKNEDASVLCLTLACSWSPA